MIKVNKITQKHFLNLEPFLFLTKLLKYPKKLFLMTSLSHPISPSLEMFVF